MNARQEREHGEHHRRRGSRSRVKEPSADKKDKNDRRGVDAGQGQVDPPVGLAEKENYRGIYGVYARELHVVRLLERRYAVKYELGGVGVLALVALKRDIHHLKAQDKRGRDNGGENYPLKAAFDHVRSLIVFLCLFQG